MRITIIVTVVIVIVKGVVPMYGAQALADGMGAPDSKPQNTRSPLGDSRLFGPSPWKILATTCETNDF